MKDGFINIYQFFVSIIYITKESNNNNNNNNNNHNHNHNHNNNNNSKTNKAPHSPHHENPLQVSLRVWFIL